MRELLYIGIAILPAILIGKFVYDKDVHKEPVKLLLKLLIIGGLLSVFLVLIIHANMRLFVPFFASDFQHLNKFDLFIYVFIGIALLEEFCKWITTYIISWNSKDLDHLYDIMLYAIYVSLGFAALENIGYVFEHGIFVGILRFFTAVPAHACFGAFMGYYMGKAKIAQYEKNQKLYIVNMILSVLIPTILHGIYNYSLMANHIIYFLLFVICLIFLFRKALFKLNKVSMISDRLGNKDLFCTNCGKISNSYYCSNCGKKTY